MIVYLDECDSLTRVQRVLYKTFAHDRISGEAKHSNRSCYANLQLSRTIKTIVKLHIMTF